MGQTLRAEYSFTANGTGPDASTFQWQWKDGEAWRNAAAAGNTARTFTLPDSYAGFSVRVVVTPKGSSHPAVVGVAQESSAVAVYGAPSVSGLKISGTPKVGQTLRAEYTFTSNGSGTDKSTFIWGRYERTSWMPIEGATGREYTLRTEDAGYSIKVTVIPEGSSQPQLQGETQHSQAVDAYGAPSITNLHISGTPKVGQTLSAEYTFTANGAGTDASSFQCMAGWCNMEECCAGGDGEHVHVAGQLCRLQRAANGNAEGQQPAVADRCGTEQPGGSGVWYAVCDGAEDLRHAGGGADIEGGIHLHGKRDRYGHLQLPVAVEGWPDVEGCRRRHGKNVHAAGQLCGL